jgi:two-component system chemotaxis response regulator CheY
MIENSMNPVSIVRRDGIIMNANANILVVDDAAFMRLMMKDILIKGGYNIIGEAVNGVDAIEKYYKLKPDLVTMDITMPEMEGIEAVRRIKQNDPIAKIIMCSAMGQKLMIVQAIQAGAKDFIIKPFQPERVLETVKRVLFH